MLENVHLLCVPGYAGSVDPGEFSLCLEFEQLTRAIGQRFPAAVARFDPVAVNEVAQVQGILVI